MTRAAVGPNAILRTYQAIVALDGVASARRVFVAAQLTKYLEAMPDDMVPEHEVTALYRALHDALGPRLADRVAHAAGRATAAYLLAHRIPRAVQIALRHLPRGLAARILLMAIALHAWTFAGSGELRVVFWPKLRIIIRNSPLCRDAPRPVTAPFCTMYSSTFACLFESVIDADARVEETACAALGAPECVFEITLPGLRAAAGAEAAQA